MSTKSEYKSKLEELKEVSKIEKMTPARLRSFSGLSALSEEEAKEAIDTMEQFCRIVCKYVIKKNKVLNIRQL